MDHHHFQPMSNHTTKHGLVRDSRNFLCRPLYVCSFKLTECNCNDVGLWRFFARVAERDVVDNVRFGETAPQWGLIEDVNMAYYQWMFERTYTFTCSRHCAQAMAVLWIRPSPTAATLGFE